MVARVIDGKAVAAAVRARVAGEVAEFEAGHGRAPALATVLVGDDEASKVYVGGKHRACEEVGIESRHHDLAASTGEAELLALVAELNGDPEVDGILVQLPVPEQIDPDRVIAAIDPAKDVDGLTPVNAGRLAQGMPGLVSCTPAGVMELLRHEGVELEGAEAVVVGRSKLVGVPVARLLLAANATVTSLPLAHPRPGRRLPPRRRPRRRRRRAPPARRRRGQAGRGGDRRRRQPHRGGPGRRRRLRAGRRGRRRDHPGPGRRRPDDRGDAPRQHPRRRPRPRIGSASMEGNAAKRAVPGTQLAGLGGLALIAVMFLFAWYSIPGIPGIAGLDAFDAFDDWVGILLVFTAFAGMALGLFGASDRLPIPLSTISAILGAISTLVLLIYLISPPGVPALGEATLEVSLAREPGIWLGLISTVCVAIGGYRAMQSEGTSFAKAANRLAKKR